MRHSLSDKKKRVDKDISKGDAPRRLYASCDQDVPQIFNSRVHHPGLIALIRSS
ncbi:MAG: hypothetical protein AAGA18_01250 [Verrucomicrobiota bacterium]